MIGLIRQLQRRTPLGWLQLNYEKGRLLVALAGIAFAFWRLRLAISDTNEN